MNHTISFWLPFPPSVNRIWRYTAGKAYLSPEYKKWKERADASAVIQGVLRGAPVLGACRADILLSSAFRRNGDADNRMKAVLDWCERVQLIVNDKLCAPLTIDWDDIIEHDCTITLTGEVAFSDRQAYSAHLAAKQRTKRRPLTGAYRQILRRAR